MPPVSLERYYPVNGLAPYRQRVKIQTLGERLRYVRLKKKLTQVQLAARAGTTQGTLSGIETGETQEVMSSTLLRLAGALDINPTWLQSGSGSETPLTWNPSNDQFTDVLAALSPDNRRRLLVIAQAMLADQSEQADAPILGEPQPKKGRSQRRPSS